MANFNDMTGGATARARARARVVKSLIRHSFPDGALYTTGAPVLQGGPNLLLKRGRGPI